MTRTGLVLLMLLSALPARAEAFVNLHDRDSFVHRVVGKTLRQRGRWMRFDDMGQIKGRVWGRPLLGNWYWQDARLCKRVFHGTVDQGEACVTVRTDGRTLYFVPEKGSGKLEKFTLE